MSVIGWITLFFITKCFIHRLRYCVYACNAICCSVYICRDIKPYTLYTTVHRFDIPYHQNILLFPLFIWAVINCVPKPVPGRNNKHQESDIVTVFCSSIQLSVYFSVCCWFFISIFFYKSEDIKHISSP